MPSKEVFKCKGPKRKRCYSACCYMSGRIVYHSQKDQVGLENLISRGKEYELKRVEQYGPCIFLNVDKGACTVFETDRLPFLCQIYTCAHQPDFEYEIDNVVHYWKKKDSSPKTP